MNDLRFALRQLLKSPGFTAVSVLTLALGIGLNTSLFTMVNGIFLQSLSYPNAHDLVRVYRTTPQTQSAPHSVANYLDLTRESAGTVRLAAFRMWNFTVAEPGHTPRMLSGLRVTASFFPLIGVQPLLGRWFTAEEDQPGANDVAILSHALWVSEFGADPSVVGRAIRVDGRAVTVVGVMPAAFAAFVTWGPAEIWRPVGFTPGEIRDRAAGRVEIVGRCAPGVSPAQAQLRLRTLAAQLARDFPAENRDTSVRLRLLASAGIINAIDTFRQVSWLTLALAGSVLLITCANLANLQLGRALQRAREYAVCAALGGSRWRLMRPILWECLLLALLGAAIGSVIVLWANDWFASRLSALPAFTLTVDWHVPVFAIAAALITGVLFGLAPAWLVSRLPVNELLKSGSRGSSGSRRNSRLRASLIVGQFALALLLVASAGFFQRGTQRLLARDPGWSPADVLQGTLSLPSARYPARAQILEFYRQLQEKLAALPGVENVGIGWTTPVYDYLQTRNFTFEGTSAPAAGHEPLAYVNGITPSFLPTLGIKLLRGRSFTANDDAEAPGVALINESMARALFGAENPIGRRIRAVDIQNGPWLEIVGVVRDVRFAASFGAPATAFQVYRPLAQDAWSYVTVVLRAPASAASLAEPFRQAVASLDPDLAVQRVATAPAAIESIVGTFNFGGQVLTGLAGLGLLLAALGIYGVIANLVVQRTPEIGIRLALGAPIRHVLWLVLGGGFRLALLGMAFGLAGTYAVARLLKAIAPALPQDPLIAIAGTALLFAVALIACWLPARRATRVDPLTALRAE